ncbi:MAG: ABC transporter ATP-binding protein [bacterium]|nr:ABC transporter ATP-binding protein [bacterium]
MKKKDRNTLVCLIQRFMGRRMWLYFGVIIWLGVSGSLFQILVSTAVGALCDIAESGNTEELWGILSRNLLLCLAAMTGSVAGSVIYNNEAKRTWATINQAVYTKALRLPMTFYDTHHSGEFMSKLIWDAVRVGDIFGSRLRRVIMPVLTVIVCTPYMFSLCPPVMAGLFLLSCLSLATHFLMVKPMKKMGHKLSSANQEITKHLSDILQGIEVVKMFSVRDAVRERFDKANGECALALKKQAQYSSFLSAWNNAFDFIGMFFFLALGIWYIGMHKEQVSSLVALYLLYGTFNWNFLQIGLYVPDLANCLVNGEKVLEFMDLEEEPFAYGDEWKKAHRICAKSGEKENPPKKRKKESEESEICRETKASSLIDMRHIWFRYEGKKENVIEDYSVQFEEGVCAAITGPSGRGKSTLAKLLLGFYPLDGGEIFLNGRPVEEIGLIALREQIAYVPQEPYLFMGTIEENIRYGKPQATDEEIREAAKLAHAHEFIVKQEKGYRTLVGERGMKLSGGERQRIAIARAIIKDAPILLLDEATSALDNESEYLVQDAMKSLKGKKTILMIAHRPSTIATADVVVKM